MKNQILKPYVTGGRGPNVGVITQQNPLMNITVNGGRYVVQGGFVMYEDGTVVENPPGAFWTEYAKVSLEVQKSVNLNAETRKPFPETAKIEAAAKARLAADAATVEAEKEADAARKASVEQARKDAEERSAKAAELKAAKDKTAHDADVAEEKELARLDEEAEKAAKAAADKEARKGGFTSTKK